MKECKCGSGDIESIHVLPWDGNSDGDYSLKIEVIEDCKACEDGERNLMFVTVLAPCLSNGCFVRKQGQAVKIEYEVRPEHSKFEVVEHGGDFIWDAQYESIDFMLREFPEHVCTTVKDKWGHER